MTSSPASFPKKRTGVKIVVGLVVLIAVVAFSLPLFVNAATLRPVLESKLSAALGRKVQVSDLHFSLFSGGVAAEGLSISDDPAFGPSPFIQAKAVKVSVSLLPLIFSHKLDVQGITILESFAWRKALIGTDVDGPSSCYEDGETALVVPPMDPAALAHALRRLHDDLDLRRRLAANGREQAERHYSDEVIAGLLDRHVSELVARHRDARGGAAA